jgi:hypothetical protein
MTRQFDAWQAAEYEAQDREADLMPIPPEDLALLMEQDAEDAAATFQDPAYWTWVEAEYRKMVEAERASKPADVDRAPEIAF